MRRHELPYSWHKELDRWETMEMVQRYSHLAVDQLAQWVAPLTAEPTTATAAIQRQRGYTTIWLYS
ncbi:hypothetical protein WK36_18825 [Burkholderia cepacia]|nr:hypothetical protein WK36_18825 [Burkholderia cepacia]